MEIALCFPVQLTHVSRVTVHAVADLLELRPRFIYLNGAGASGEEHEGGEEGERFPFHEAVSYAHAARPATAQMISRITRASRTQMSPPIGP